MADIAKAAQESSDLALWQAYCEKKMALEDAADEIERLRRERDMWRQENLKKQIACEQMGARIVVLEASEAAARREGIEAAAAVASKRAASRHSTVAHCHSDRSKKHMQIRADEAGQLVADIRALLEGGR